MSDDIPIFEGRPQEAMALYEESLRTKKTLGDTREVAVTQANYGQLLLQQDEVERAVGLLRVVAANTVAVMTGVLERRDEWRQAVAGALATAQRAGDEDTAALLQAVLAAGGPPAEADPADLPFDPDLIPQTVAALLNQATAQGDQPLAARQAMVEALQAKDS